ncbi:MAG: DUF6298 domain-containing protein [Nibricoccus sp.]
MRLSLIILCSYFGALTANLSAKPPIDFSHAGFGGGGHAIPDVPVVAEVFPTGADDTAQLQNAIDRVSLLQPNGSGFRGVLLLRGDNFRIDGQVRIRSSGVILRGAGATLIATGKSRRSLIQVSRPDQRFDSDVSYRVTEDAPPGTRQLKLTTVEGLAPGGQVVVRRPSTVEWIASLGMNKFSGNFPDIRLNWAAGSRDIEWQRVITNIDKANKTVTLDAPITTAIELKYGAGFVGKIESAAGLQNVGIENLTLRSEFDASSPADEEHAWIGIQFENTGDAWVRNVVVENFVSAAVWLGPKTNRITVQDCTSGSHVGADAGWRRFGFYVGGQQILVQRCRVEGARQPFLAGLCSAGPNVFLDCIATGATGDSGSIESWASGVLFDNLKQDSGRLVLGNVGEGWQGAGWNAANSTAWNCKVQSTVIQSPPDAPNEAFEDASTPSLYRAQLRARLGEKALAVLEPKVFSAKERPAPANVAERSPRTQIAEASQPAVLAVKNGRFVFGSEDLFGAATSNAWWKGQTIPRRAAELGWSATRWSPGKTGPGLTEDLAELASRLAKNGNSLVQVWPGLWYDRRRDDHLTVSRTTADVWAPFYESPWARSGQGTAADGLSKYDLTKFNPWYWGRLREFARECAKHHMVLYHHFYNHHNFVEAAAHWAEFPWRSANCLQETGFTEPPPFTSGDTRIGIVADFYDVSNPVRRALHQQFIWHGLDVFADEPNVIHTLAFQFAGPLSFQQFFLDTVAEWETARGKKALIALNTSKTITDSILADPKRSSAIAAIDMRYWQYLGDGSLFAPHTDGQLAFRENRIAQFGRDAVPLSTAELVYKQVREYHDRFPQTAIIAGHAGQGPLPILMAGGAQPLLADYAAAQPLKDDRDDHALISFVRTELGNVLAELEPVDISPGTWCLSNKTKRCQLYFSAEGKQIALDPAAELQEASGTWFDVKNGTSKAVAVPPGATIAKPNSGSWLLLIRK